jgi:hypothetical protein
MTAKNHGGARIGAGRKPSRTAPRAQGIWCGEITQADREYITQTLTPGERHQALLDAADRKAKARHDEIHGVGGGPCPLCDE